MKYRLLALFALTGCGLIPEAPDGGPVPVPGSYRMARLTPGHLAHLSLKGEKKLQCTQCHELTDAGFTSPGPKLCETCHEAQVAQHHPLNELRQMSCFTCHPFTADRPGQHFEKWRCLDCHREPAEGHPAIEVHEGQCASCHRPHLSPFTQAAACEGCHDVTVKHGFRGETQAQTCMACHPHHTKATVASRQCVSCHQTAKVPVAARVQEGALFKGGHEGCGTCHTAHTFVKGAVKDCTSCHESKPVLASAQHTCTGCHRPHTAKAAPVTCESCHKKTEVKHPKSAEGQTCTGCHPPHDDAVVGVRAKPCTACHSDKPFNAPVVHAAKVSCTSCHEPHDGKPEEKLCRQCHEGQYVRATRNPGHADCAACHDGLPHGAGGTPAPCLSCHEDKQPPQKGHSKCSSCHEDHSGRVTKTNCTQCHEVAKLPGLHREPKHLKCTSCHAAHTPQPGFGPKSCQSCHSTLSKQNHPTPPQQCTGCHLFKAP